HIYVLCAGVVLLAFVALRTFGIWKSWLAAKTASHNHAHAGCTCDHGDGHTHSFAPWRYAVLLLPILIYLMDPWPEAAAATEDPPPEDEIGLSFEEFLKAAYTPASRAVWTEGELKDDRVRVKAMFESARGPMLNVYRMARACCLADSYRVYIPVVA